MSAVYKLPTAKVLKAAILGDTATVEVEISLETYLTFPIAPADLRETDSHRMVFPFHGLIAREGEKSTFETYRPVLPVPPVGSTYTFCSWWIQQAMLAVIDTSCAWKFLAYPDNGSHDHCLITWDTISAYTGERHAYHSRHGWITVQAYREFIEQDVLRLRNNPRSIELVT
jgi:hypothetical protein